jgi:hypothetical protein
MKIHPLILFFIFLNVKSLYSQVFKAVSSEVTFFSEAPLENIQAVHTGGQSFLNFSTNEVAVVLGIRGFKFENALMEEHFNENYMESDKYKVALFKGVLQDKIDYQQNGVYEVTVKGTLDIHGVSKERIIPGKMTIDGSSIKIESHFQIRTADHKIKIPKAVVKNIAEIVEVQLHISYQPKIVNQ